MPLPRGAPEPARGHARVPGPLLGTAAPVPVSPAPGAGLGPGPGPGPHPHPPEPPDPQHAVRAYGASLFTAESPNRAGVGRLLAIARTPQPAPQVVSVLAGQPGLGTSATAAGLARTLATVREDHTALLGGPAAPVDPATIAEVRREHAFTVVDLGADQGEQTPLALAASTRVVVVTAADRRASNATRVVLERIHQVHPSLASHAVVAVVCRNPRQFRRVSRDLGGDPRPQAGQVIPIPYDPAVRQVDHVDLTRLRTATREAFLRLAAILAVPQPAPAIPLLPTSP